MDGKKKRILYSLEFLALGKADWQPSYLQEKPWVAGGRGWRYPLNYISPKAGEGAKVREFKGATCKSSGPSSATPSNLQ